MHRIARTVSVIFLTTTAACASTRGVTSAAVSSLNDRSVNTNSAPDSRAETRCADCGAIPMPTEITKAVERRIANLKARGGDCSRYGEVLESSYRSGRITIRPYMWRVGTHLASGEAKPNGEMMLAREIDSLNVGVRTVDDVLWTMEHEAAHIAFDLASGNEASEEKANQTVRACSAASSETQATGALTLVGLDGRSHTVSTADLARLTRHDTTVSAHEVTGRYSGVALTDLLALVNAPLADSLRGRSLSTYVLVEAADGYRVVFSIAELDSRFTDRVIILADKKDGEPLAAAEGPYRLIVPGEKRPARWARQVVRISLGRAP